MAETELLIKHFENDVRYGMHALMARIVRSDAAESFLAGGRTHLAAIAAHLEAHKPDDEGHELRTAWCLMLSWISKELDGRHPAPITLTNIDEWIAWAKKEAE